MNGRGTRTGLGWGARLLVAFVLVLIGAAAAVWALAHYQPAARFLGIAPQAQPQSARGMAGQAQPKIGAPPAPMEGPTTQERARISALENRLQDVENATQRAEGFAGRADALVVAFAARRAIDRGVALGYLENLLVDRFGQQHRAAVATIITASHQPVRLQDLIDQYEALGPELKRGGPQDSWWTNFKRELGSLVEVHRATRPAVNAEARYNRAMQRLSSGDVDQALAETMRLPGAARAGDWVAKARRYITAHRALDEVESAALLGGSAAAR
jgi:hypothetical protein